MNVSLEASGVLIQGAGTRRVSKCPYFGSVVWFSLPPSQVWRKRKQSSKLGSLRAARIHSTLLREVARGREHWLNRGDSSSTGMPVALEGEVSHMGAQWKESGEEPSIRDTSGFLDQLCWESSR